jgi:hypothetical protein
MKTTKEQTAYEHDYEHDRCFAAFETTVFSSIVTCAFLLLIFG